MAEAEAGKGLTRQQGREEREAHWRQVVAEWAQSGLTQAEFCRQRGIPPGTFGHWKQELARRDAARQAGIEPAVPADESAVAEVGVAPHTWTFYRTGGFDQVKLETVADLAALGELDQKLWVALSCPTRGLEFDPKTLELIDTDQDGRIRVPEMLAAVRWACGILKDPGELTQGADALPLESINDEVDEGKRLLASARQILTSLGKPDATTICVADASDTAAIFSHAEFNGDGVLPPALADDEPTRALIADVIACVGGETDLSGKQGVTQAKVDQFFADLEAYAAWRQKIEENAATILPLGDATAAAYDAFAAVRSKVDDYFARCRLAAFDARAAEALNRSVADFQALAGKDLSTARDEIATFPLARVEASRPLPLDEGVNPAWAGAMARLQRDAVSPILGEDKAELTADEWARLVAQLTPYEQWLTSKAGASVEKLGPARISEILAGGGREAIAELLVREKALEQEMKDILAVDRLVRYHRDLYRLLNNFVAFAEFYAPERTAVFQAGTLYLDRRSCDLCVRVDDPAKHATLATLSKTYLAYCDCTRKGTPDKMTIAAAFTSGDSDYLMVGRNGVFYDRQGQDWDATITKIVEHPISLRQAFLAPYKRIVRLVGEQVEKMALAREKAVTDKAGAALDTAAKQVEGKPPAAPAKPAAAVTQAPPQAFDIARFVGIFAAVGLAIGALGTAVGALLTGLFKLAPWHIPLIVLGVLVAISGASVLLAWLKLRQRNLAPILDANGWAVNARVRISIPFGRSLTQRATMPLHAKRSLRDPYARRWPMALWAALLLAAVLAGSLGYWWFFLRQQSAPQPGPAQKAPTTQSAGLGAKAPASSAPASKAPPTTQSAPSAK